MKQQRQLSSTRRPQQRQQKRKAIFPILFYFCFFISFIPWTDAWPASSVPLNNITPSSSSTSSSSSTTTTTTTPMSSTNNNNNNNNNGGSLPLSSIKNFRNVAGTQNIYRCASPDVLGEYLLQSNKNKDQQELGDGLSTTTTMSMSISMPMLQSHDQFVLESAHLVLDLRSPTERDEFLSKLWMNHAGMRIIENSYTADHSDGYGSGNGNGNGNGNEYYSYQKTNQRCVVRIDVLSPSRMMKYIDTHWLMSKKEIAQCAWYKVADGKKLHELRIEKLNERGLAGLNEAILETGKDELFTALTIITEHLEQNPGQSAVIHCVQGKDRTGMLSMLLQSIMGVSDVDIIADYYKSNEMLLSQDGSTTNNGSAAVDQVRVRGKLDRRFFSGTNEQAMISALHFLRGKYGSVCGYLDSIGFHEDWRRRLLMVLVPEQSKIDHPTFSRL